MAGMKRRQEEDRGMRVNPEMFDVEDADDFTQVRRQYLTSREPRRGSLPGAWAHIEKSRKFTEQERSKSKPGRGFVRGFVAQGKTEALRSERLLEVGFSHSSEEAVKAKGRAVGAKGRTGQGTCWRER